MDDLEKLMIILVHATPNHYCPKMDVFPKAFLQITLASKWYLYQLYQVRPTNNCDDLCLPFCTILILCFSYSVNCPVRECSCREIINVLLTRVGISIIGFSIESIVACDRKIDLTLKKMELIF